ncbi:metallophosphoesterase [Maribacter confluentis]|uniref:Metallophosphoesterase n=1 Tax=Maribacter confluentis TaxID=1656093 RepID=A0ABT8RMW2_9FLAO|nr:metallophosphoesterase [Maribacter confluentis]MDO1511797.1 metallophosphoesterase [Maribacter confluentis]
MERRKFLKETFKWGAGLGILAGMYSWQLEPFWLEFVRIKMPVKNLPGHLIGKTLMQISDIHIGNSFDYQYIIDSFKEAQSLKPDFVVYTGDYVSYEDDSQFIQLKDVLAHAVTGSMGTVAVLGNHDYGINYEEERVASEITGQLINAGVTVLRNEAVQMSGLQIIGIDDMWGINFYPEKAMKQFKEGASTIVLCHNPDVCDLPVWNNYKGWILSGHTHGGQVKPPFLPPPMLPVENRNYTAGVIDLEDGRSLYINRALGCLLQVRFNVRPEITLFTLERED